MALSAKKLTWAFSLLALAAAGIAAWQAYQIQGIHAFNQAIATGKSPSTRQDSYEAKFAVAYWQARNGRYQEATQLFGQLQDKGNNAQKSAVQYNTGNIFFLRGLEINGRDMTVRDETEYLLTQARTAYEQSLRLDYHFWDARHNLDRVLSMLPSTPTPGSGESDSPGLIMGNIPVGLP
ncbi:hypothetical protein SAMN05192560_2047 [Methylobacillus rhizosphaerae]|uniref:MxaK protein n=1 Tax=Methylobacillus rhizosphaerae TaxID=551994 RepID=A0A239APY2_9PROT|nr:hypothetical protein [Methylobacillus rhizosphaerae]SNR97362.1 hypothetical protein SAMN05192560_2047 [Methylobacillus rhizosphaerae]